MTITVSDSMRKAGIAAFHAVHKHGTDADLVDAIYIAMQRVHLQLPEPLSREEAIAEIATNDHA